MDKLVRSCAIHALENFLPGVSTRVAHVRTGGGLGVTTRVDMIFLLARVFRRQLDSVNRWKLSGGFNWELWFDSVTIVVL